MNFLHNIRILSTLFFMINFIITTIIIMLLVTTSSTATTSVVNANRLPDNVIELVGYNHNSNIHNINNQLNNRFRKARQQQQFLHNNPIALQNLNKKQRADIETVKQNIAEYNKLMKVDTKKLSEQQKVMIERIVERVARLKEDIIKKISDSKVGQNENTSSGSDNNSNNNNNDNENIDNNDEHETSRMSSTDFYDSTVPSTIAINNNMNNGNNMDNIEGTTIDSTYIEQNENFAKNTNNEKYDVKFVTDETTNLPQESTDSTFMPTINGGNSAGTDYVDSSTIEPKEPVTIQFNSGSTGSLVTQQFYTTQNAEARSNQNTNSAGTVTNSATTLSGNRPSSVSVSSSSSSSSSSGTTGTTKSKTRNSSTKRPSTSHNSSKPTAKRISSTHHYHHHRPSQSASASLSSGQSPPIKSTLIVPSISTTAAATTLINNNNNDHTSATNNDDYQTTITTVPVQHSQTIYKQQQQQQQQQPSKQQQQIVDQDVLHGANNVLLNQKQQQQLHQQLLQQHQQQLKESNPDLNEKLSNEHNIGIHPVVVPAGANPEVQIQQRTPIGAAGYISSELLYNTNGTTSTLIDSLSTQSREDYYNLNKQGINNGGGVIAGGYGGSNDFKQQDFNKKPSGTAKPTKYHYYPHNQHIYLLPECAIQQVCNAVYVRLNYTQPLCACPSRYRDPCSASLNEDDNHTTKLVGDSKKKAITLAKTCEATTEMRECRSPKDWSLLALQNTRTGKSHYLVICRCPDLFKLEFIQNILLYNINDIIHRLKVHDIIKQQ